MNKKEINEIKKQYRVEGSIRTVSGCYVNADRQIVSTFQRTFLNLEENVIYKYIDIFKKGLSGTIGKNLTTYSVDNSEVKRSLQALKSSDLKNEQLLSAFYQQVIDNYPEAENFAILIINNTYDVPYKGKDGLKNLDASESVYDYIHVFICPAKLEKPGLIYSKDDNMFIHKEMRYELQAPVCSIIYPSFEDRCEDPDFITCYSKDTSGKMNHLLREVFALQIDMSPEEQTEGFQMIMKNVMEEANEKIEAINEIHASVNEKISEAAADKNIELGAADISKILEDSGISEKGIKVFHEEFANTFGEQTIPVENLFTSKSIEVKTPDIVIKVKPEKKKDIQQKIVDGRKCLVIGIDQDAVEVNGIDL